MQATGNDFLVLDNRQQEIPHQDVALWSRLCTRRTGIGADGVLFLENSDSCDFHMRYLNSDGKPAKMCGNGTRAITLFAHQILKLNRSAKYQFTTDNGEYSALITSPSVVQIEMGNFSDRAEYTIEDLASYDTRLKDQFYINSGVEHLVLKVDEVDRFDLTKLAPPLRSHSSLPYGANINLVQLLGENHLKIRTFEKGVEGETLSCGTGTVAAALAAEPFFNIAETKIRVTTSGGDIFIHPAVDRESALFSGEVQIIFSGSTILN